MRAQWLCAAIIGAVICSHVSKADVFLAVSVQHAVQPSLPLRWRIGDGVVVDDPRGKKYHFLTIPNPRQARASDIVAKLQTDFLARRNNQRWSCSNTPIYVSRPGIPAGIGNLRELNSNILRPRFASVFDNQQERISIPMIRLQASPRDELVGPSPSGDAQRDIWAQVPSGSVPRFRDLIRGGGGSTASSGEGESYKQNAQKSDTRLKYSGVGNPPPPEGNILLGLKVLFGALIFFGGIAAGVRSFERAGDAIYVSLYDGRKQWRRACLHICLSLLICVLGSAVPLWLIASSR